MGRALVAQKAYKQLTNDDCVTPKALDQNIQELFASGGIVDSAEEVAAVRGILTNACHEALVAKMPKDQAKQHRRKSGAGIELREFVDVATNNDIATLRTVATFVDETRWPSLLEVVFDESGHAYQQRFGRPRAVAPADFDAATPSTAGSEGERDQELGELDQSAKMQ